MDLISRNAPVQIIDVDITEGRTRFIELSRPRKLNCLSLEMLDTLLAAVGDPKVRRLVLTGAGRAFCTGLDLNEIKRAADAKPRLRRLAELYRRLLKTDLPTVAFARGYAAGGGVGLAACAKLLVVSSDFKVRLPAGGLARLASIVIPVCNLRSRGRTPRETCWLGCELDATEAHDLGLVDKVVSPGELTELVERAKRGVIEPSIWKATRHDYSAVNRALRELDEYLQGLETW